MKRKLHSLAVRLGTMLLPLKVLRAVYRGYSRTNSFIKYGDSKFPRIVSIEISTHCNRTCSYCPNVVHPMTPRLIKNEVMDQIAARLGEIKYSGCVDFIFFNEPAMNPHLANHIRTIKKHCPGAIPRISTNGDFLTEKKVADLIDAGIDRIYVMRHVPTPVGWVERIMGLSRQFPGYFVLMDIEKAEMTDGLHDFNGLVEVKKHRGRHIVNGKARCQVHRHIAQITIDGEWNLCCVDYAKSKTFGNILQRPILDIWRDPKFVEGRRLLEAGIPITKTCSTCTCLVERKPEHIDKLNFTKREADPNRDLANWKPTT